MTVVAYRDNILAIDSQASCAGHAYRVNKFHTMQDPDHEVVTVLTYTGDMDSGMEMIAWYTKGADPKKFPASGRGEKFCRLIVANGTGLFWFEQSPYPMRAVELYMAFGSGRDYALGAMAREATAIEAVEATIKHSADCMGPVVAFDLSRHLRIQ